MNTTLWQPSASLHNLRVRSQLLAAIRHFFHARNVMEVETPLLCHHTNPDPSIESFELLDQKARYYLQTSPEFAMKRLLAAGSGPIYQLAKAFRREEAGRYHNPEFTLLEWYRPDNHYHALMTEVDELLQLILGTGIAERITYEELFVNYLRINPHTASVEALEQCARAQQINYSSIADKDVWLNLLLTHGIEPHIGLTKPIFIYDYPASQAALARVRGQVAERFEVYFKGMELANGFHELSDPQEQEHRFTEQIALRQARGQPVLERDHFFLEALRHGLPDCSGVALGVDRLVMIACHAMALSDTVTFDFSRA